MHEVTLLLGNNDWITHPLSVLQYTFGHEIKVGKACSSWTARMPQNRVWYIHLLGVDRMENENN